MPGRRYRALRAFRRTFKTQRGPRQTPSYPAACSPLGASAWPSPHHRPTIGAKMPRSPGIAITVMIIPFPLSLAQGQITVKVTVSVQWDTILMRHHCCRVNKQTNSIGHFLLQYCIGNFGPITAPFSAFFRILSPIGSASMCRTTPPDRAVFDNRHQHVDRDGDPFLRLHRVVRDAVESPDPQVLLDPRFL
jgi:hypothetical protein